MRVHLFAIVTENEDQLQASVQNGVVTLVANSGKVFEAMVDISAAAASCAAAKTLVDRINLCEPYLRPAQLALTERVAQSL